MFKVLRRVDREKGFTLIEMLVTVAILAITVSYAAPNITRSMANQSMRSEATSMRNLLETARAESSIRRKDIILTLTPATNSSPAVFSVQDASGNIINQHVIKRNISYATIPANTTNIYVLRSGLVKASKSPSAVGTDIKVVFCHDILSGETPATIEITKTSQIKFSETGSCK